MRIKSYFSESIRDAMERARVELGPDAMLVSSKKVGSSSRHMGAYEVVFGLPQEGRSTLPELRRTASPTPAESTPPDSQPVQNQDLVQELANLRRQIETVSRSVSRQNYQLRWTGANASPELGELHAQLLAADFSDDVAQDLVRGIQARLQKNPEDHPRLSRNSRDVPTSDALSGILTSEIENRLEIAPFLSGSAERRIVMLVGAPGSGKTSTLVKIAVQHGTAARVPVQILSTDTLRLGGAEQLASYARIIGAGFRAVHSAENLEHVIEEYKTKKLFLIDTPGYDVTNLEEADSLIGFLKRMPHVEVHLVVPVSLRATSTVRLLQRFAAFKPQRLLLTRLDEVESPGAALEPVLRSGLPVSFLGTGQQVPEDLEPASKSRLMKGLPLNGLAGLLSAA